MTITFDGVNWNAVDATGKIHKSHSRLVVIEAFLDWWENQR